MDRTRCLFVRDCLFWKYFCAGVAGLMFSNLLAGCFVSFDCLGFWPTLSYVGCFRTHDRVFAFIMTLLGCVLPLLGGSVYAKVRGQMNGLHAVLFFLYILGSGVCIVLIGITDEINGVIVVNTEDVHPLLTLGLVFIASYWVYLSLTYLESSELTQGQRDSLGTCWFLYRITLIVIFFTAFQWHFAYTIYSNYLVNERVEAVCEYVSVLLTLSFPHNLCKVTETSFYIGKKPSN